MKILFFGRTINVFRLISLVLVLLLAVATYNNITSYISIRHELNQWKKNYQIEIDKNKKAKSELIFASDPAYLEEKIRNELGRQKEGEEVFVIDLPLPTNTPFPTITKRSFFEKLEF